MVSIRTVDRLVGVLVVGIILFGIYSWWQATQRVRERGGMMRQMMGTMPGTDPIWYLFGTLVAVSVVLGVYIFSREKLVHALSTRGPSRIATGDPDESNTPVRKSDRPSESESAKSEDESATGRSPGEGISALTFLPEDEQRVIEPILESPGLTQVELRGRSGFSKAKVSQTVSGLEDRGLIYREKQGRTYRVYPGELLKDRE